MGVYPQFKDLCVGAAETTLDFKGGLGSVQYVVSGNVSETPRQGTSELVGGFFQTYVTGMSISGTSTLPKLFAYKLQNNYPITEGGLSLGTGTLELQSGSAGTEGEIGDKFWFSSSQLASDDLWLEENFDGSNKSMGAQLVLPGGGNAIFTLADAYISPKLGAEEVWFGGDAFMGGGDLDNVELNLARFFSEDVAGVENSARRVFVRPVKKNHIKGLWVPVYDTRNSKQKWQIYLPYWKWDKIKPILNFASRGEGQETGDPAAQQDAAPENTIFNELYKDPASAATYSFYGGAGPGADLVSTTMKLMPSEGTGIGQSLEIKNAWDISNDDGPENYYAAYRHGGGIAVAYGGDQTPPVQTSWASLFDIPYPLANNVGALAQTTKESGAMASGDQRVAFPEINISMKINSLLPSPALDTTDPEVAGNDIWAYGTTGGTNDVGATSEYTGTHADIKPHNKTFWRSIVITFSNYKPEAGDTLDDFLLAGLNSAYGRTEEEVEEDSSVDGQGKFIATKVTGPKIVTGLVFSRFYAGPPSGARQDSWDNAYMKRSDIYAYSLPMCAPLSGTGLNDGLAGLIATTGGSDSDLFNPGPTVLHRPEIGPLSGSSREGYPYVRLPGREFFNVRFVFDVQQVWDEGTGYGWWAQENDDTYTPAAAGGGVPIRAYFTNTKPTVTPEVTTWQPYGLTETKAGVEADEKVVPYINLSLPAVGSQQYMSNIKKDGTNQFRLSTGIRCGTTKNFPKHMTIWVSNFGMAPGSGSTPHFWAGNNKWFDDYYWVPDDKGYPIYNSSGNISTDGKGRWSGPGSVNTTLFIDSIDFKYWNASMTQMSTAASQFSRPLVTQQTTIPSPATTSYTGDEYTKAFGVNGYLNELPPGQNFTIGYKHWDWLPVEESGSPYPGGGTLGAKIGYMLFNNFSSKQFGLLERNSPTAAWISSLTDKDPDEWESESHSLYAGHEMYGNVANQAGGLDEKAPEFRRSKVFVTTGSTNDPDDEFSSATEPAYSENAYICCGFEGAGNWLSNDGLTQKGFMKLTMSSGNSASHLDAGGLGYTVARENVLTSAKITSIAGSPPADGTDEDEPIKNAIKVDNIEVFQEDLDDEYIIYRGGESLFTSDAITASGALDPFADADCGVTLNSNDLTVDAALLAKLQASGGAGMAVYQTTAQSDVSNAGIRPNTYIINTIDDSPVQMSKKATGSTGTYTLTFAPAARNALGYKNTIKMVEKDLTNSTVLLKVLDPDGDEISTGIEKADDNVTDLCNSSNLFQLYISPKRIWMNMMYINDGWEAPRQYENICMIDETPATGSISTQLGTTYNEALYTYNTGNMATKGIAAVPERPWVLGVYDESSLMLSEDYGFGSYDTEKNEGGQAGISVPILNTQSYIDISGLVKAVTPGPSEELSLVLGLTDQVTTKVVTIVGDDDTALDTSGWTFYRPQYVWEYYDGMPSVTEFTVAPQFDLLAPDVNLYEFTKQPINNLKFTWSEDGDDIWYRHLIIDASGAVDNKYHRSDMWIPFNEYGTAWTSTNIAPGTANAYAGPYTYYTSLSGGTSGTIYSIAASQEAGETSAIEPVVTGISGYAPFMGSGSQKLIVGDWATGSDNQLTDSLAGAFTGVLSGAAANPWKDEWSLVVHCNPNLSAGGATPPDGGVTVCGIVANVNGILFQHSGSGLESGSVSIYSGNRALPSPAFSGPSDALTWDDDGDGGFDLLHVFLRDNKVQIQYAHEYTGSLGGNDADKPYLGKAQYELIPLSSSRVFPMDGSEELNITLTFNMKRGTTDDATADTDITSNDQLRLYINGQLEDSESLKYSSGFYGVDVADNAPWVGGFGRTNYNKFIIGAFNQDTDDEGTNQPTRAYNITANCGDSGSTYTTIYNETSQSFKGSIEEVILYPYEILNVESAGEYIMDTRGFNDYTGTGTSATELNYNARLFVYDYTNVRGKSTSQVASSNNIQWKVTGV